MGNGSMPSTPLNSSLGLPPVSPSEAAGSVYMGSKYSYTPGAAGKGGAPGTSAASTVGVEDVLIPQEEAWGGYAALPPQSSALLDRIMDAKRPYGWNQEERRGVWADGIMMSNSIVRQTGERVSPLEALRRTYLLENRSPGVGGGGGSGGGYSGPVSQTRLTDPLTAKTMLDNSLKSYLGRAATKQEESAFLKALKSYEMENPTVVTPQGPGGSITTGGTQPTAFAEQFAQSQEGAAEYQAATTYFDSFLSALKNPVG